MVKRITTLIALIVFFAVTGEAQTVYQKDKWGSKLFYMQENTIRMKDRWGDPLLWYDAATQQVRLKDRWGQPLIYMDGQTVRQKDRWGEPLLYFDGLTIRYKTIIVAPMIERIDLSNYLNDNIEEVSVGGESGRGARPLDFDWVLSLREQCIQAGVPFRFHQTGAKLIKDGRQYYIRRCYQHDQAKKAGVDFGD